MLEPISRLTARPAFRRYLFAGLFLAALWAVGWLLAIPVASFLARAAFRLFVLAVVLWLLWRAYQRLLWRVSGRLAFSYFLIGVVPIPLALILVLIVGYGVTGFYLARVFHDAVARIERDLALAAATRPGTTTGAEPEPSPIEIARYRDGRKVEGSPLAPETWPAWLARELAEPGAGEAGGEDQGARPEGGGLPEAAGLRAGGLPDTGRPWAGPWVELPDGSRTLAAAVPKAPDGGVVALYNGNVEALIRERSGLWVLVGEAVRRQTVNVRGVQIHVGEGEADEEGEEGEAEDESDAPEQASSPDLDAERSRFFGERAEGEGWADRALFAWVAIDERPADLATGEPTGDEIGVFLQASPRMVARSLFGVGAELVEGFWIALVGVSLLLLTIYAVAELVAIAMIVGLSRAVSRLYSATSRVASGDFSVRVPVRRRDQVGALQRSFNAMAENLEDLVATAAQTELVEKELQMARQVQQSLIPQELPGGETVEFSTLFEPSAAIGGDYFDVLRLSDDELAVVVADVSGHGLPTGLRMAMVKAALGILVVETREAPEILRRLDRTVRSEDGAGGEDRFFVTAVFSRVDFHRGTVEVTNAGHPPVYLLRGGVVEEMLLPGSPLGGLGHEYGRRRVDLEDGDVLVWLSDGLIEATDGDDEPFGYEGVERALAAGPAASAGQVRDRLLAAVAEHTGGRPAQDDRTLVVMRYSGGLPSLGGVGSPSEVASSAPPRAICPDP